jgi:protein SCO1/2
MRTGEQTPAQRGGWLRRRTTIFGAAVVVVLLAVAAVVGQQHTTAPKPPSDNVGTQVNQALPSNIMSLPLVDERGNATNLAAFKGKIVVLTDFLTLCQEVCPLTTSQLRQAALAVTKAGLADKVQFVEITVDPERDTPDQLHAYRDFAQLPSNFSLLTGTPENLATLWHTLGVGYDKQPQGDPPGIDWRTGKPLTYDVQHTDVLMFIDEKGIEKYLMVGMPNGEGVHLNQAETAFLNDEGRENLKNSDPALWNARDTVQVVSWLAKKHIKLAG